MKVTDLIVNGGHYVVIQNEKGNYGFLTEHGTADELDTLALEKLEEAERCIRTANLLADAARVKRGEVPS